VLMALGGRDEVTFDDICLRIAPLLQEGEGAFVCHYFPEATHAFDEPRHRDKRRGRVQYNPEAAAAMLDGFSAFAGEQLGVPTAARRLVENCPVG
jgi:dienelactone hydrolase